ncbi:MAG TPA: DUF4174 domain-containing protein [Chthoniobacteraceae bacterium]|nr:DUF4174 domain-containing protein [Chthoniobacteraceae bacterium]
MKKALASLVAILCVAAIAHAAVVRLAPEFGWTGAGNKHVTLKSLRGQPVVLIVADSVRNRTFRKQAGRLKELYQDFANRKVVFFAAFGKDAQGVIPSDVPFVTVDNGAKVAADYGVQGDFALIVIGPDGNVDMQSSKLAPATRIRDVIINSFPTQSAERPPKEQ